MKRLKWVIRVLSRRRIAGAQHAVSLMQARPDEPVLVEVNVILPATQGPSRYEADGPADEQDVLASSVVILAVPFLDGVLAVHRRAVGGDGQRVHAGAAAQSVQPAVIPVAQ